MLGLALPLQPPIIDIYLIIRFIENYDLCKIINKKTTKLKINKKKILYHELALTQKAILLA